MRSALMRAFKDSPRCILSYRINFNRVYLGEQHILKTSRDWNTKNHKIILTLLKLMGKSILFYSMSHSFPTRCSKVKKKQRGRRDDTVKNQIFYASCIAIFARFLIGNGLTFFLIKMGKLIKLNCNCIWKIILLFLI